MVLMFLRHLRVFGRFTWHLMHLRMGPEDIPASRYISGYFATLMFVASVILASISSPTGNSFVQAVADIIFLILFCKVILFVFGFPARFLQTFGTLCASHVGFYCVAIPLQYLAVRYSLFTATPEVSGLGLMVSLLYLTLLIWWLRVVGHIYASALNTRLVFALGISALYFVGNLVISALLLNVGPA